MFLCKYFIFTEFNNFKAIYYDPSPKYSSGLPNVLDALRKPVLKSFTKKYGVASGKNIYMLAFNIQFFMSRPYETG